MSEFLSRDRKTKIPEHSCKHTLVWKWLQDAKPGNDDTGEAIRLMRKRMDMPRTFPNKRYMRLYLDKCYIDLRQLERLWSLYRYWLDNARHDVGVTS